MITEAAHGDGPGRGLHAPTRLRRSPVEYFGKEEAQDRVRGWCRVAVRGLLTGSLVLVLWLGLLAGVMRLGGAAPAALVLFPGPDLMAALPEGTAVLSQTRISLTVRSEAGLVAALYAAGAPLVLPAGLTGCLPARQPG